MAQSGKHAGLGIIEGKSADARHGVPQPDPQLIVAVLVLDRLDAELERLILPLDLEG